MARNPQDSTLRNVRASQKRDDDLAAYCKRLGKTVQQLKARVLELEKRSIRPISQHWPYKRLT